MAKVFLSAGHGGIDPGATAYGLKEKDINLQVELACGLELERHGVKVIYSRIKDEYDPVGQEVIEANNSGADIAVSFHINAGGGDGFEAFYYLCKDERGKKLAELCEKYVKEQGQNSRGLKTGNHLWFVKHTTMPAVLVETFFIDSVDRLIGDTVEKQQAFGKAYAKAILEYFGIKYISKSDVASSSSVSSIKVESAKNFNKSYAKSWTTTSELNLRSGAGLSKNIIKELPKNSKVRCYGYYSTSDGITWLFVVDEKGTCGFVSKNYLK